MITLDTNVVVRLIVGDDPDQARRAVDLIGRSGGRVQSTVMLEAAWVLGRFYKRTQAEIAYAFMALSDAEMIEAPDWTSRLGECVKAGLSVADSIQLYEAEPTLPFATFDATLFARAPRIFDKPSVITP
jgi:predicted nucleic acid-binding protein